MKFLEAFLMSHKPTYEELEQRVKELEEEDLKRKQLEEALTESEEKYKLLIKNLPCVVYRGFKDFSVEFFDNKIELFTGFNVNEFNSKRMKWSDIILKEDIEAARIFFIQALKADRSYVREYRIRTKLGEIHWIQERGQIICNNKGEIKFVSGVFFDITDYKRAEDERIRRQKLQSILEIAGAVCHEMNQPIQGIYLNLDQLLINMPEDNPLLKKIIFIKNQIDKLASITDKLQSITRYETKEYILGTKIIDIEKSSTQ
ncbi:MAG: PAS domain-containing protein [Desulfobacterales bacterium]